MDNKQLTERIENWHINGCYFQRYDNGICDCKKKLLYLFKEEIDEALKRERNVIEEIESIVHDSLLSDKPKVVHIKDIINSL
jgi:hypothetical protein